MDQNIRAMEDISISMQERNTPEYGRYITMKEVDLVTRDLNQSFKVKVEGVSQEGREIKSVNWGYGETRILMWSQMHGNESTTTKAVLDLFQFLNTASELKDGKMSNWQEKFSLKIVPVLNPDGAFYYTRNNANNEDLNRDAFNLSQVESKVLRQIFEEFSPNYAFNLHDQRTIFGVGETKEPATISFLAPSFDIDCSWNESRTKAMKVIVAMQQQLQKVVPGKIGRFDDSFNINCIGDYFQYRGVPTILIEAGHYPLDYRREKTRKVVYLSLLFALEAISTGTYQNFSFNEYMNIPENAKTFSDIMFLQVKKANDKTFYIVKVQFLEKLENSKIIFVPIIADILKEPNGYAHLEVLTTFSFNVDWELKEEIIGRELVEIIKISTEEVNSLLKNNVF